MNIGIIGYGRMGKAIERIAKERSHIIGNIVDHDRGKIDDSVECYIDFSTATATKKNLEACCRLGIPVILGTTGWGDQEEEIKNMVKEQKGTVVFAVNFSLGVNLFLKTVAQAAGRFGAFADTYDTFVHEFHHNQKIDSPGGTALQIGRIILENHPKKEVIHTEKLDRKIKPEELHVTSTRGGSIPGTHSVFFDSPFDTIELKHTARTRDGFAMGAVLTAEKIQNLKPGFHLLPDIFDQIFS